MEYEQFLETKKFKSVQCGFDNIELNDMLFPFQKAIVSWAIKRGRACIFADTGLGKTFMQVSWADNIYKNTLKPILILAPLCVAEQTVNESKKLNINVKYLREFEDGFNIIITNYEMIDKFVDKIREGYFSGIVLDESSILKHQDSKTREKIIDLAQFIENRLSCTATPSPNDFMEFGGQSEFLGVMPTNEMLSMFFVHDSENTSKWRLKGHGKDKFWEWLSNWCVYIKKPSDLGFDDNGFILPKLNIDTLDIGLFGDYSLEGLNSRHQVKEDTVDERVLKCAELVNGSKESFIVWCMRNDESSKLARLIPDAIEVSGSDSLDDKHDKIMKFTKGESRVIITKAKITGYGLNWQHCNNMCFVGLNDSYEQTYQAIRRCYRFGQKKEVNVFFIAHAKEGQVLKNIRRKELQANEMTDNLVKHMAKFSSINIIKFERERGVYKTDLVEGEDFKMYLGDCIDSIKKLDSESIGYSIFSPPFVSLYTYSNSDRDFGNSKTYEEFFIHFDYLIKELMRVTMSGRLVSVHCMNLPTSKQYHGYIGIQDFRGDIIRAFQKQGFIYQSEVCIWKDPVVAMQRTKALGLLWKQIKKDSSMSRMGIPDYIMTFRKDGLNPIPISHTELEFPVDKWQRYASPCWMDINQSNTLNYRLARGSEDERHICPLQLDVIYRCIDLWSKEGDTVLSPFAGIGSEGFVALKMNRKFIGFELKESYFKYAVHNLKTAKKTDVDFNKNIFKINAKPVSFKNKELSEWE